VSTSSRRPFRRLFRGALILALIVAVALVLAWPWLLERLGGAWEEPEAAWETQLSPEARALLDEVFEGLEEERLVDIHFHLAGLGTGGSGCEVNPKMRSWAHPVERVRMALYLSAGGVEDMERADQEYVERVLQLVGDGRPGGRYCVLAFDRHHREDGTLDPEHTEFYVPNEYAWDVAGRDPEHLIPVISVHPYRKDALVELDRWAARGVRMVKWLPNAMGIDPASSLCDPFYDKLVEHDLTLLSHTGKELAVDAAEYQELGNPLRLRRALDRGVRVIAAHCATLGKNLDLDDPEQPSVSSFELFLRLMGEERYVGQLWGDLSAVTLINRVGEPLRVLLERTDLHPRLINGSDYPIPAINAAIHLGPLVRGGLLDERRVETLQELYRFHPLAFDLALKRCLHAPGTEGGFAAGCFHVPDELGL